MLTPRAAMKDYRFIVRFRIKGTTGPAKYGLSDGRSLCDLSEHFGSWGTLVEAGHDNFGHLLHLGAGAVNHDLAAVDLLTPVDDRCRIFCVALNYRSHVNEVNREPPAVPLIFMKPDTAAIGPGDEIAGLGKCQFLDYEGELAVVIGRSVEVVSAADVKEVLAGLTLFNDVTARDLLFPEPGNRTMPDWLSAKGLKESTPIGPWVLSSAVDSDPDLHEFQVELNGGNVQNGQPDDRIFSIGQLVSFLSHRVGLRPGDVVATGTPTGTGKGRGVPLQAGDTIAVTSERIGRLENRVAQLPRQRAVTDQPSSDPMMERA